MEPDAAWTLVQAVERLTRIEFARLVVELVALGGTKDLEEEGFASEFAGAIRIAEAMVQGKRDEA